MRALFSQILESFSNASPRGRDENVLNVIRFCLIPIDARDRQMQQSPYFILLYRQRRSQTLIVRATVRRFSGQVFKHGFIVFGAGDSSRSDRFACEIFLCTARCKTLSEVSCEYSLETKVLKSGGTLPNAPFMVDQRFAEFASPQNPKCRDLFFRAEFEIFGGHSGNRKNLFFGVKQCRLTFRKNTLV